MTKIPMNSKAGRVMAGLITEENKHAPVEPATPLPAPDHVRYLAENPRIEPCPTTGCWIWTGAVSTGGYGSYREPGANGKHRRAHRLVWEHLVGPIPEGYVLDHVCRVRICVNPDHLRVVTIRENTLASGSRALAKANAVKTECPKCGGAFGVNSNGKRECRPCANARHLARYHANRDTINARRRVRKEASNV